MHPDNRFYGHGRALARAAGLPPGTPIRGHVQHGWSLGTGFSSRHRLVRWLPLLGWSDRTRAAAASVGLGGVTLVGAPFLYLAAEAGAPTAPRRATIAYPFHGTERHRLDGSHRRLAAALAERETGPVTVCLYWADHDPQAVAAYEERGFTVITHGHRRDPGFLARQREALQAHDRIVSNQLGTALWYGAHLGLEAEVYGPSFGQVGRGAELADHAERLRDEWPELHRGPVPGAVARTMAAAELGVAHQREAGELADLLFPADRARVRRWEGTAALAEHHLRRLGVHVARRLPGFRDVDASAPAPADVAV
jgi:hypothetical protein